MLAEIRAMVGDLATVVIGDAAGGLVSTTATPRESSPSGCGQRRPGAAWDQALPLIESMAAASSAPSRQDVPDADLVARRGRGSAR